MTKPTLVIRGRNVLLPQGLSPASLHVSGEKILSIGDYDQIATDCEVIDAEEQSIVMPGLIDTHVHVNEPGRTDWEGFETATKAAAAGGITTIVDMPLNSIPPTTTLYGLNEKLAAARNKCFVDVGFWGGVVPGNTGQLQALREAGVVGFKCFLIHSGVDEFPNVTEADLRAALPELVRLNSTLIVHAEVPGPIDARGDRCGSNTTHDPSCAKYETFLASRPRDAENQAVELMIRLAREFGATVHIVHHSSADALPLLRDAKAEGLAITAETCPHYLAFTAENIPDGATEFKCCPPIRERQNNEQLWDALANGTIDMIVSDHSPCPPDMKLRESGDFLAAWGGISSLQLRLPIVWTEAKGRSSSLSDLSRWLTTAPAKLVNLDQRKGTFAPGYDADIVIWNPEKEFKVRGQALHHRHKLTPYEGGTLAGVVEQTFLRGQKIYDDGEFIGDAAGLLLL